MQRPSSRYLPVAGIAAAGALFAASPALAGVDRVQASGELVRFGGSLPAGARAHVTAAYDSAGDSRITLEVWGLRPRTEYGAHAHVLSCGDTPDAAGPHYQHVPNPDPEQYPTDPAFANPFNEVWLDLTTDARGHAVVEAEQAWQFPPGAGARSVIIHEEHTGYMPQDAGLAGARLGCLDVTF